MYVDTQVRPQGEQVDAVAPAKLKLSQAIRIGAKLKPQIRDGHYRTVYGSCAIGAAFDATGIGSWDDLLEFLGHPNIAHHEITARNDGKNGPCWTREQIADWLEAQGL